ncbi:MAG: FtsQ-type POTRA domain-containing protein [Desulfobulbus sp.]|jgi:hypothetical protein|nr:FtsQ-type POTRA domain-containing protein [Desulfobulbus sp.]
MAVYTPRKIAQRVPQGGGRKRHSLAEVLRILLRRRTKTPQYSTGAVVSGAQRLWKWKRLSQNTLLVLTVCGALVTGLWFSYQALIRSDIFRLSDIHISGHKVMTERQIFDLSGLQQGASLLQFRPKAAAARIATHPWVQQVEITTRWPSTLAIKVHEQQALALVNIEGEKERQLRYLNRDGQVFAEIEPGMDIDHPVITGLVAGRDVVADTLVRGGCAEAALTFLQLASQGHAVLPLQGVSEVHLDPKEGLIIYLVDRPFPIYFGWDRLQTKYYRLIRVLDQLYGKKQVDTVKEIRMDYADDKVLVVGSQTDG